MRPIGLMLRPYFWNELPGWGRLYQRFVGDYRADPLWQDGGLRRVRGKLHGYEMEVDLARWSERFTWFFGRFYDLPLQLLVQRVLSPGDLFCDVGANIGMVSLIASAAVGPSGRVFAFEPNPRCAARIERWKILNDGICQLEVRRCGLSDSAGSFILSVPKFNSGEASLAELGAEIDETKLDRVNVDVRVGDAELVGRDRRIRLVKIDVEGFEIHVLRGLQGTIESDRPVIVVEAIPSHLARCGHSLKDMIALLEPIGYSPFVLTTRRKGLRHQLDLPRWDGQASVTNLVWIHKGDPFSDLPAGTANPSPHLSASATPIAAAQAK